MVALIFILSLMLCGITPAGTDRLCELNPNLLNALTTGEPSLYHSRLFPYQTILEQNQIYNDSRTNPAKPSYLAGLRAGNELLGQRLNPLKHGWLHTVTN